jgi:transposase
MRNASAAKTAHPDGHPPPVTLVGLDAHSRKIVPCLTRWEHGSDPVAVKTLSTALDALEGTCANHVPPGATTVLEATTNAFSIVRRLNAAGHSGVGVLAADTLAGFARRDRVNDSIDAANLALAHARGGTREVFVPSERHRHLRDLFHGYNAALQGATRASNRLWGFCGRHGPDIPPASRKGKSAAIGAQLAQHAWDDDERFHIGRLLADYAHAAENRALYLQRIERAVATDTDMLRVMQVPGIGVLCAFALVTFIEDIRRFGNPKKLAAYFGFNPAVNTSGETNGPRRLSRFGQRKVKAMLVEAAHSAYRFGDAPMHRWARRKAASGKNRNAVLCALARKMLVAAWHVLMGHPAPEAEAPAPYRRKLLKLAQAVARHPASALGGERPAAFAARVCGGLFSASANTPVPAQPPGLRTIPPASA